MTADPLVSIVIPVFNGADFLGEAIDSALAQTYRAIEVIVVDDGSDDGGATRAVAMRYGDRIRYVHKPNGGVSTALNAGIATMRGAFFCWLSHDDVYRPNKIETQIAAWRRFGRPCIVVSDWDVMDDKGTPIPDGINDCTHLDLTNRPLEAYFHVAFNGCAMLIPRSVLLDHGFDPGLPRTQDNFLWFQLIGRVPFVRCATLGVVNRQHPAQGSRELVMFDEAGMCFVRALDKVSPAVMEAYGGSESGFLWWALGLPLPYPGVARYLRGRMAAALERQPFTLALVGGGPAAAIVQRLGALEDRRIRPRQVLVVDLGITGDRDALDRALAAWDGGVVVATASPGVADLLTAAAAAREDIVVIAGAVPEEDRLAQALAAVLSGGAPVARPGAPTPALLPIEGWAFRRAAIPGVAAALAGAPADGVAALPTTTYPAPEPQTTSFVAPASLPVRIDAFSGSDEDIARLNEWRHGFTPGHPVHLIVTRLESPLVRSFLARRFEAARGPVNAVMAAIEDERASSLLVYPAGRRAPLRFRFHVPDGLAPLRDATALLGVAALEIHDVRSVEALVPALAGRLQRPYEVVVADRSLVPSEALLRQARRVVAASPALAGAIGRHVPGAAVACEPPTLRYPLERRSVRPFVRRSGEPLRVLVIGDAGPAEGSATMARLVALVERRGLPIRVHALGRVDGASAGGPLVTHPAVEPNEAWDAIAGIAPHLAWLPYERDRDWLWELDVAMWSMLPVAGTAVAGMIERCRGRRLTRLCPPGTAAEDWVDLFLQWHADAGRGDEA
ncbi:glycosyltransferase [Azospirillum sp. ST 5-10]|uniref:glycosyltransferase n=1 Tax=unclassified Azospirillum TaxID=2630922 RepID=UPI003F4A0C89